MTETSLVLMNQQRSGCWEQLSCERVCGVATIKALSALPPLMFIKIPEPDCSLVCCITTCGRTRKAAKRFTPQLNRTIGFGR